MGYNWYFGPELAVNSTESSRTKEMRLGDPEGMNHGDWAKFQSRRFLKTQWI